MHGLWNKPAQVVQRRVDGLVAVAVGREFGDHVPLWSHTGLKISEIVGAFDT